MNQPATMRTIVWVSWTLAAEEDRRFRRLMQLTGLPMLLLMLLITLISFPEPAHKEIDYTPPRYAELLPPPPPPVEAPKPETKPEPTATKPTVKPPPPKIVPKEKPPEPTPEQLKEQAHQEAEKEMKQFDLTDLRDQKLVENTPVGQTSANVLTGQAATGVPAAFEASATQGSTGIGRTSSLTGAANGTGLGEHQTGRVHGGFGNGLHMPGPGGNGAGGRSFEQIQRVFDESQNAFYAIFNRAARENPSIGAGKILVNLTIAPDGSVTQCEMVSSTFGDPELERKILARIRTLNFGAKAVPVFNYPNYPINYLPPS